MKLPCTLLALSHSLFIAAGAFYTGFSYGNHWDDNRPRTFEQFREAFKRAKDIRAGPVVFNSARIFSCLAWKSQEPSPAFKAAIETNTTLFLGLWLGHENGKDKIDDELHALDKAFEEHGTGNWLANLIVGISVGSEDLYRGTPICNDKAGKPCKMQATAQEIAGNITAVRNHIARAPYGNALKNIPIGHVDTAISPYLGENASFVGMTAYPFWANASIEDAKESFMRSLDDMKKQAKDIPVWIAEMGWPFSGEPARGNATAGKEQAQRFWRDVGCPLFGKYNIWWYELDDDSSEDPYNWSVMDDQGQHRFDLSCPGLSPTPDDPQEVASSTTGSSSAQSPRSTFVTLPAQNNSQPSSAPTGGNAPDRSVSSTLPSNSYPAHTSNLQSNSTSALNPAVTPSPAPAPTQTLDQCQSPDSPPHRGEPPTVTHVECITILSTGIGPLSTLGTATFFSNVDCHSMMSIMKGEDNGVVTAYMEPRAPTSPLAGFTWPSTATIGSM